MDTEITPITPSSSAEKGLFTERAISTSTFLGGPLAGTFLIAHNFTALEKKAEARFTWIVGVVGTIVIIPLLVLIPDRLLPNSIARMLEILWVIPAYLVVRRFQKDAIERHLSSGGKKGSAMKAATVGIASMLIILLYAFSIVIFTTKTISDIPDFPRAAVPNGILRLYTLL